MAKAKAKSWHIGVGMPNWLYLNLFGKVVFDAFGDWPFLVGSAATGKQWRDVDVRLILDDERYVELVGKVGRPEAMNKRWCAFNMAFSELGRHMTGLPIDFQIQRQTDANALYPNQVRCALIMSADIVET